MHNPLVIAWFVALFAVVAHLFAHSTSSTPPSTPLHAEYALGCSTCELVVRETARERARLGFPRRLAVVLERDDDGVERDVHHQASAAFARDALSRACARDFLVRFTKRRDWLDDAYFVLDDTPRGPNGAMRVDADARLACRRLTRFVASDASSILRDAFVASTSTEDVVDRVCANELVRCPRLAQRGRRFDVKRDWKKLARTRVALVAFPWVFAAAFAPFLALPSVFPPVLPKPAIPSS